MSETFHVPIAKLRFKIESDPKASTAAPVCQWEGHT